MTYAITGEIVTALFVFWLTIIAPIFAAWLIKHIIFD